MTFTFGWALAILVVMYYVSSVLSIKTRARIGTMIFFSVFILIGYWTIFPKDIIQGNADLIPRNDKRCEKIRERGRGV